MMIIKCFLILYIFEQVQCFNYDELEIFDLVEEINRNFYEVLDISKEASASEIRRGYRKKSLVLHPDKNKEEGAEDQFRQLASIYEVLKDKEKRKIYDNTLEFGLPDWKQPAYYYRRVYKLGIWESTGIILIIFTVVHFICLWAIFLEKKFVLFENLRDKYNQKKSRKKQKEQDNLYELELEAGLESIYRPQFTDIILIRFALTIYRTIAAIPFNIREHYALKEEKRLLVLQEEDNIKELEAKQKSLQPKRQFVYTPPKFGQLSGPVLYNVDKDTISDQIVNNERVQQKIIEDTKTRKCGTEWTDEDYNNLSKSLSKLPGGTPQRWEKISDMVGRPLIEVATKAKQIKAGYVPVSNTMGTKIAESNTKIIADNVMTQRICDSVNSSKDKGKKKKVPTATLR